MHEFSVASSIVENVVEFAEEQHATHVISVRVALGELAQIEADQLTFCYASIITNTTINGSTLEIESIEALVRCPECSYQGRPKYWSEALCFAAVPTLQCPECSRTVEIIQGEECTIKMVRFTR